MRVEVLSVCAATASVRRVCDGVQLKVPIENLSPLREEGARHGLTTNPAPRHKTAFLGPLYSGDGQKVQVRVEETPGTISYSEESAPMKRLVVPEWAGSEDFGGSDY